MDNVVSANEQILDFLKESASSRGKTYEMVQLHMQNQAKKIALKEMEAENKILLKQTPLMILTLASLSDLNKQESYKKELNNNKPKRMLEIYIENTLVILEVQDQIYLNISIVIYISMCNILAYGFT